jgi:hypothetical protein
MVPVACVFRSRNKILPEREERAWLFCTLETSRCRQSGSRLAVVQTNGNHLRLDRYLA